MSRAKDIYERVKRDGLGAIDSFIADRQAEELFLDFKRSSCDGKERCLSGSDRKNFSKAISGFGNSEGGVIIWGVDCGPDLDGADVAKALRPVENPKRFASLLQGAISGCTVPPHSGVEIHAIERDQDCGFVAALIPKSNAAPLQSVVTKHYHIRTGSDFLPTPHDVLAGMFGRRPQPHVFHHFLLAKPEVVGTALKLSFGLAVHNEGPGIADDIFVICRFESFVGPNCEFVFEAPDRTNWNGSWEFSRQISLISSPTFRLPPGANAQPLLVKITIAPPFEEKMRIWGRVGAGTARRYEFSIDTPATSIDAQYWAAIQEGVTSKNGHRIAEAILKGSISDDRSGS